MDHFDDEKPSDRELLEIIVHGVDRLELGQVTMRDDIRELKDGQVRIERRVGSLENHVDALDNRLERVENRLGRVENRLEHVEKKVDHLEYRFDLLDEQITTAFDGLDERVTTLEARPATTAV